MPAAPVVTSSKLDPVHVAPLHDLGAAVMAIARIVI
jgi:hypothetical protein